jgi:nucleoside-diphosphate-sugar epimerase
MTSGRWLHPNLHLTKHSFDFRDKSFHLLRKDPADGADAEAIGVADLPWVDDNPLSGERSVELCEIERRILGIAKGGDDVALKLRCEIGPHDLKPTPTGMIIVQFLNGRIPVLARTGLNFADVRQCALGHLLAMVRGQIGERYLLGGPTCG